MIEFRGVSLQRGGRRLLQDVSFKIAQSWKTGVIGVNGCGKSSLLALIEGRLEPDAGTAERRAGDRIASLPQHTPWSNAAALDFVLDGDAELKSLQRELGALEADGGSGLRIASVHERMEQIGAYAASARASRILSGLGFSENDQQRPVCEFSGGWRMRLALGRVLLARADLLILDEPTNHLDLDAVLWLQSWLESYPGSLLLVSHDRELLDESTDHTLSIADSSVRLVRGNYSEYERLRARELALQSASRRKQELERERLAKFVARFRAKASKARQVQSRLKVLSRLEEIASAHADTQFRFELSSPRRTPDPMLTLEDVCFSYSKQPVLAEVSVKLRRGSRIGLLGPNGAGKSTLMRLLAGLLDPDSGTRILAPGVEVGYLAQHQMEQLDDDVDAIGHVLRISPRAGERQARDHLGGFGFSGDRALERVGMFSGGEKARLTLALMVWREPALLLLDEPTNHLDLEVRQALIQAFQTYEGAMVLVSHDRYLLRACCDQFLILSAQGLVEFDGDLDDYHQWLREQRRTDTDTTRNRPSAKADRQAAAQQRQLLSQRRRPLERELARLESRIDTLQLERDALQLRLSDNSLYSGEGSKELQETLQRHGQLGREIEALETEWLRIGEALELVE